MTRSFVCIALFQAAMIASTPRLPAQEFDDLPTERVEVIPPGGLVDLDSGAVLPVAKMRAFAADLRFDRDGGGFFLEPLHGGQTAPPGSVAPDEGEWSPQRVRISRRSAEPLVLFVRTDRGVARVTLAVSDPYSTASAVLRWVVVPPKDPVFLPPPTDLLTRWEDGKLLVNWSGDASRWLVEVRGKAVDKHTVGSSSIALGGLDPDGHYRLRVRGMERGAVSLPADVVQHGRRVPARREAIEFPGRRYDGSGGLRLSTAEVAVEEAEIVFYLYGVYVPGGGVVKLGEGERDYRATHELPAGPYPPSYGRLDEHDVLAVELPDGRCGKLWLEPMRGDDLRDGMRVHTVFLPDGRRLLQPPPQGVTSILEHGVVTVSWQPVDDAVLYRAELAGQPLTITKETTVRWPNLPPDTMFEVEVTALSEGGDASEPVQVAAHTFGPEVRVGTAILRAGEGGVVFATGAIVTKGRPCDLALVGGAGGSSSLTFGGAAGISKGKANAFGDFRGAGEPGKNMHYRSDVRNLRSGHFYVHTADGGLASVRIVERGWPNTSVEFVWRPAKK